MVGKDYASSLLGHPHVYPALEGLVRATLKSAECDQGAAVHALMVLRQALSAAPAAPTALSSAKPKASNSKGAAKGSDGDSDSGSEGDGDGDGAEPTRLLTPSLPSTSDMLTSPLRSELMRQALQIAARQPGRQSGKGGGARATRPTAAAATGISSPSYASFMLLKAQLSNGGGSADQDHEREARIEQRASKTAKVSRLATQNLCHAAVRAGETSPGPARSSVLTVLSKLVRAVCGDLDDGGTKRALERDDPRLSVALSSLSAIAQLMPSCYAPHARRVSLVVESLLTGPLGLSQPPALGGHDNDDRDGGSGSDSDGDGADSAAASKASKKSRWPTPKKLKPPAPKKLGTAAAWQQVDLVYSSLKLLTSQLRGVSASDSSAPLAPQGKGSSSTNEGGASDDDADDLGDGDEDCERASKREAALDAAWARDRARHVVDIAFSLLSNDGESPTVSVASNDDCDSDSGDDEDDGGKSKSHQSRKHGVAPPASPSESSFAESGQQLLLMLPPEAKAGMRLVAAHSLLTFVHCVGRDISASLLTPTRWHKLAWLMHDPEPAVRLGFVDKLAKSFELDPFAGTRYTLPCVDMRRNQAMFGHLVGRPTARPSFLSAPQCAP